MKRSQVREKLTRVIKAAIERDCPIEEIAEFALIAVEGEGMLPPLIPTKVSGWEVGKGSPTHVNDWEKE